MNVEYDTEKRFKLVRNLFTSSVFSVAQMMCDFLWFFFSPQTDKSKYFTNPFVFVQLHTLQFVSFLFSASFN